MSNVVSCPMEGSTFGKFILTKKLGEGSFGSVFESTLQGKQIALKIVTKYPKGSCDLYAEYSILQFLSLSGAEGFPKVYDIGKYKSQDSKIEYWWMAMELLGADIGTRTLTWLDISNLAKQLLSRLERLAKSQFVFLDIKPTNLLFGLGDNKNKIYLIDFGCAERIDPSVTSKIRRPRPKGNPRFASISISENNHPSFKDDLESLGYLLVYLTFGTLPWMGGNVDLNDIWNYICKMKKEIPIEQLCQGNKTLENYFGKIRAIDYTKSIDYQALIALFN